MNWQIFTIISVISLSISVVLQRVLIHKNKVDPYAYAVTFQGIVGLLLLIAACANGFSLDGIGNYLVPAAISVICFGIGHIFYAKTLQAIEASNFSVLFATQAVWTMLLGIILLGEQISALQIVGTVLIFASALLLTKNIYHLARERGIVFGLATGLLFGIAVYFWSYVGRYVDSLSWAAISFLATSVLIILARPRVVLQQWPFLNRSILAKMVTLAIFYGLGSYMMLLAYKEGSFAVVSPLRQTSILVTVLLALVFLPAERTRVGRKMLAAVICMIGVICILV